MRGCHKSEHYRNYSHYLDTYNVCNIHFIRDAHAKPNNVIHDNNQYYCGTLKHQSVAL